MLAVFALFFLGPFNSIRRIDFNHLLFELMTTTITHICIYVKRI